LLHKCLLPKFKKKSKKAWKFPANCQKLSKISLTHTKRTKMLVQIQNRQLVYRATTNDNTTQHVFFHGEVNSIVFERFCAADYDSVLEFFQARQDFEIIGLSSVKNDPYCNL
jgi:hypothetical protein